MYKIVEKNQIIDVVEDVKFIKYLPKSKRMITVDKRQANGCISSNDNEIYHIEGTPYTFEDAKHSVQLIPIDEEEYKELTSQMKENEKLNNRVQYLEQRILELEKLLRGQS